MLGVVVGMHITASHPCTRAAAGTCQHKTQDARDSGMQRASKPEERVGVWNGVFEAASVL